MPRARGGVFGLRAGGEVKNCRRAMLGGLNHAWSVEGLFSFPFKVPVSKL